MNIAIILSGGVGSRMRSDIPKQYIEVKGRPILAYAVDKFLTHPAIDKIIIALNDVWVSYAKEHLDFGKKEIVFCSPGATREHTIYNALKKAKEIGAGDDDIVIIHDGVRPLVSERVISDCLHACDKYEAAIASIDVNDTIYVSEEGGVITSVPNRSLLRRGQTPEAFNLGKYLRIHDESTSEEISAVTGGAQFAQQKGLSVFLSRGEEINFKITTPEDLQRFEQIIQNK
ncbi:MAG: 2-C-methyl-D-erythritol 4-phosphate cytidylyltransferase [Muribaculaceae bacterium]|nr:2-C-methyl-D-erythritol 4-phosphate cytidylyltransferase [Muribaculaceae bacterium]